MFLIFNLAEMLKRLVKFLWYRTSHEDVILTDEMWEVLFEDDGSDYEKKTMDGIVTQIREAQGLAIINKEIYMDLSVPVLGGRKIRLGDHLVMIVKRRLETDAWRVERVDMIDRNDGNEWDANPLKIKMDGVNIPEHYKSKVVVGKVTDLPPGKVAVNDGEIIFKQSQTEGVQLIVGDWLSMTVVFDPEEYNQTYECMKVEPLRTWHFEGKITFWDGNVGIIDDEVHFQKTVYTNEYVPNVKDLVHVTAIESAAFGPDLTWRALSVIPSSRYVGNKYRAIDTAAEKLVEELLRDKNDVVVERLADFGTMQVGSERSLRIQVTNIDYDEKLLIDASFRNPKSNFELTVWDFPIVIPSKGRIALEVTFKAETMGKNNDILELNFGDFQIGRSVSADVGGHDMMPERPELTGQNFKTRQNSNRHRIIQDESERDDTQWILRGVRPYKLPAFTPHRLGSYPVPRPMWRALTERRDLVRTYSSLSNLLGPSNYKEKLSCLLHLEEVETTIRLRQYDIDRAALRHFGPYLALEVKGLAEKRPSLIPGDSVILTNPWGRGGMKYEGFIHQTLRSDVLIQFHPQFHQEYTDEDYAVSFQFNRTPLRRCHQAVELAVKQPGFRVLFPSQLEERPPQIDLRKTAKKSMRGQFVNGDLIDTDIDWVNPSLNQEQRHAVLRILEGVCRPIPYIIYGPPGTGKTVTVVEAILQVFLLYPHSRILVATPSNSSADLIAERLHYSNKLQPGDMIRLNAFNRNVDAMPEVVQRYSVTLSDLQRAVLHRIVISTCTTSGTIYTLSLKHGHFTHVFIDEAGQATEPESLIPIGLLRCDSKPGQIILAGDPKQLGPVLMSQYSALYGLSLSLLERLSLNQLYSRSESDDGSPPYNPKLLTKLVRNYRSHPSLLTIPSRMFYDNELMSCASAETSGKLAGISWLPAKGIPLVFHGVRGENFQETDSPSWFNPAEVYHVARYLQKLLNHGVDADDIGIITPYRKQVEKIRQYIQANDLVPAKVASVEEFQGQEREVIIVSTTRSNGSLVDEDVLHHLGFIRSPKRFNVTITRAKSLLIVVGNPHLLVHDEHWGPFLQYSVQMGAYTGCDLPIFPNA